ncbi:MAG: hypothetical protein KAG92_11420, partial [Deltaproteobacteria bacterium]|nr:hypothetical protein [Deltaproteobacteria bacterium]
GGIKEKILAARRAGIYRIILPENNLKDLKDLPLTVRDEMVFLGVKTIDETIPLVITSLKNMSRGNILKDKRPQQKTNYPPATSAN